MPGGGGSDRGAVLATLADAEDDSKKWEFFVRADNLTDETHRSFYFKSMGNEFFALDKPRIIMTGITLKL